MELDGAYSCGLVANVTTPALSCGRSRRPAVAGELIIEAWGGQAPDDAGTVKHQVARLRRKPEGSGVRSRPSWLGLPYGGGQLNPRRACGPGTCLPTRFGVRPRWRYCPDGSHAL